MDVDELGPGDFDEEADDNCDGMSIFCPPGSLYHDSLFTH